MLCFKNKIKCWAICAELIQIPFSSRTLPYPSHDARMLQNKTFCKFDPPHPISSSPLLSLPGDRGRIRARSHSASRLPREHARMQARWCCAAGPASCLRSGAMNIVKGVADLLRKSMPSSSAATSAGCVGGGGASRGGDASTSTDKLAAAPSPRVCFMYTTLLCNTCLPPELVACFVRTIEECAQVALQNSSLCL
jgi:hypothetical protein